MSYQASPTAAHRGQKAQLAQPEHVTVAGCRHTVHRESTLQSRSMHKAGCTLSSTVPAGKARVATQPRSTVESMADTRNGGASSLLFESQPVANAAPQSNRCVIVPWPRPPALVLQNQSLEPAERYSITQRSSQHRLLSIWSKSAAQLLKRRRGHSIAHFEAAH